VNIADGRHATPAVIGLSDKKLNQDAAKGAVNAIAFLGFFFLRFSVDLC